MRKSKSKNKQQQPAHHGPQTPAAEPKDRQATTGTSTSGDSHKDSRKPIRSRGTWADWCSVIVQGIAAIILYFYTRYTYQMWQTMEASNRTAATIADTNARLVDIAQRAESPAFTVARAVTTVSGKNLKLIITLKNSGKGVATIRQTRWVIVSERGAWSRKGTDDAPDSTLLGPGDTHEIYEIFNWNTPEALAVDAIVGVRVYVAIDYADAMGQKRTDAICQHYDSANGTRYCLNAGPD